MLEFMQKVRLAQCFVKQNGFLCEWTWIERSTSREPAYSRHAARPPNWCYRDGKASGRKATDAPQARA